MTTIASDGQTVAADGRVTAGDEILYDQKVKLVEWGHYILGFAGMSALSAPIIEWFKSGADPEQIKDSLASQDWSLCVFGKDGVITYHHNLPYPHTLPYPFALGAGENYALGALLNGASPIEAVEIAAKVNCKTGGKITVLDIPFALAMAEAAE